MQNNDGFLLNMDIKDLLNAIDLMYDELIIYDDNYTIVYINQACSRHYSSTPEQIIGKTFFDLTADNWWEPSILPKVYEHKKSFAIKQKTYIGKELLTIAIPIFDEHNNIRYVVMNVRDEVNEKDLYNPSYIVENNTHSTQDTPTYKSKGMASVIETIQKISNVNVHTVFSGESGTGKTMLAQYLHSISDRKNEAFISINCATIPEHLVESELFGYTKGAFTGAKNEGKKGLFEVADKGILFLDEVTELSPSAQAKLLHVLQNGEYLPIGGTKNIKVNVRILAATNKILKDLVTSGAFREDLYYRLNVVEIHIPPLRTRKEDIHPLINHFMEQFNKKYGITRYFTEDAIKVLNNYHWKGNIRELKHILERLVVTIDSIAITSSMLPKNLYTISEKYDSDSETITINDSYDNIMHSYERKLITQAYNIHNSSRKLAKHLGISQTKANNLIIKHIKFVKP